jgi:hypothetical protein
VIFNTFKHNLPFWFAECNNKRFGAACGLVCGNCLDGVQCHHINGSCINGCDKGYRGLMCTEGTIYMYCRDFQSYYVYRVKQRLCQECKNNENLWNAELFYATKWITMYVCEWLTAKYEYFLLPFFF